MRLACALVAVVTTAALGCETKKHEPPPSAAPPSPPPPKTPSNPPPFPGAPAWATGWNAKWADTLADAYDKNPVKADRDYKGKTVEVFGIIDRIEREGDGAAVYLRAAVKDDARSTSRLMRQLDKDGVRAVACHFGAADSAKIADVSPEQLVSIRGTVKPPEGSMLVPSVVNAALSWMGDNPRSPPSAANAKHKAVIAARSAEVCFGDMMTGAYRAQPADKLSADEKSDAQAMEVMAKVAHEELAKLGVTDVACPTASLFLDLSCEEARKAALTPLGCGLPEVKAIMASMQKPSKSKK
jgi:hypothetical protein